MSKLACIKLFVKAYLAWYWRMVPIIRFIFRDLAQAEIEDGELRGKRLIFTAFCMLLGKEDIHYSQYEDDKDWWQLRLFLRQN